MPKAQPEKQSFWSMLGGEAMIPLAFVTVIILMVVPIPTVLLDLFLTLNISMSLVVLLLAMYSQRPLEFSTFPSVLLVLTLFRLSLNVASTRLILGRGAEGSSAAGRVIESFGNFVVGGNYVVGIVIFLILALINFIVITKGSGRIAEVAARFTLDAMPGKQLAVDAELNSGLLSEAEAKERRRTVEAEADFYGAMDGASKFVRGDAIAGLLIAAVNVLGGLFIGVVQSDLGIIEAAEIYTTLTIGDGLVSQLPALLISTAAGVIVTRAASGTDLGSEVTNQLFFNPKVLATVSVILAGFALVPGLPFLPFVTLSGTMGALAWARKDGPPAEASEEGAVDMPGTAPAEPTVTIPEPLDLLELEVGYEIVPLVDAGQGGELIDRIRNLRSQLGQELGLAVPPVHIRDNLQLKPGEYAIVMRGVEIARADVRMGYLLAISPGETDPSLPGVPTKEPAFGLDALWVATADRERAQLSGYTVVDTATVIVTHLTEVIRRHAHELLGRQEVQVLLDALAKSNPKVIEELIPQHLSVGGVQKVLQNLLRESVSIRDLLSVVETLADHAPTVKDSQALTEHVRQRLGRSIVQGLLAEDRTLPLVTLAPGVERIVSEAVHRSEDGAFLALEPATAQRLVGRLSRLAEESAAQNRQPVLLCSGAIRSHVRRFAERFLPSLTVLAPSEIPTNVRIHSTGIVQVEEVAPDGGTTATFRMPPREPEEVAA